MKILRFALATFLTLALWVDAAPAAENEARAKSEWVYAGKDGQLVYKTLPAGDRIMDFSYAGYRGGGVTIPTVPVKKTVKPAGSGDAATIQQAIEEVAKLEPVDGLRGAVLLEAGTFDCDQTITISTSGVVVRGSGSGANGTILKMTGKPHVCFTIGSAGAVRESGNAVAITESYVPSGANSFSVANAAAFKVGDFILVRRPVTPEWVKFMGMDGLVRDGKKEHWVSGDTRAERTITRIDGNKITLDVPLSDSYDAKYLQPAGASIVKGTLPARLAQVGVENLRIVSPAQAIGITEPQHNALRMRNTVDAWVRDLEILDTINSLNIGGDCARVTVEHVDIQHTVATKGAAKPADFATDGCQILFNRCTGTGNDLFYFITGGRVTGPNVLLNCVFHGNGHIQPHMRWATGLLIDNCQVPESGIDLMNRGQMGSGHGWTIGWAVAWNCVAKSYVIQQPPGSMNWAIGCMGKSELAAMPFAKEPKLPTGIFDASGTPVAPTSLYLAQLRERLGAQALKNIGY